MAASLPEEIREGLSESLREVAEPEVAEGRVAERDVGPAPGRTANPYPRRYGGIALTLRQ